MMTSILSDMRPLRLARHLAITSNKADMRNRNLDFLRLVFRDKSNDVLFATFPKSGWNWCVDITSYAIHKHFRGEYTILYEGNGSLRSRVKKASLFRPADARARHQVPLSRQFPAVDLGLCLHTHGAWKASPLWGLDVAKTVLVARNIPTALYSYYRSRPAAGSFEDFVKGSALDRCLKFYNSWARFARRQNTRLRVFNYEDLRQEPVGQFGNMIRHVFGVELPKSIVEEAVDYFSFEKQKARELQFSSDEKPTSLFRGAVDYSDMMTPQILAEITAALSAQLDPMFHYLIAPQES